MLSPEGKKYKIDRISKTKNNTKNSFMQKMSAMSIPFYPANLATFEERWTFGHQKRPFWTAAALKRDMIWYEILRPQILAVQKISLIKLRLLERT